MAFEQPGYSEGRRALQAAGAVIRPVPVDEEGLDPADLDAGDAAAYTTPAHQFPLGARLSAARRAALIGWARRARALVIEDDYDGEFRYDVRGLPALHSMTGGPDVVAYLGTASKILSPGLRVAWMIAPPDLRLPVRDALARTDERISAPAGTRWPTSSPPGTWPLTWPGRRGPTRLGGGRCSRDCAGWGCGSPAWTRGCTWSPICRRSERGGGAAAPGGGGPGRGDVLGQFSTAPLDRRALVCGYALLPETQAAAAASLIAGAVAALQ